MSKRWCEGCVPKRDGRQEEKSRSYVRAESLVGLGSELRGIGRSIMSHSGVLAGPVPGGDNKAIP
jgi:hypothetical protein